MKVLLIGATGNLGIRLIPALLTYGHDVVAFVRSPKKLASLLPKDIYQRIIVVEGSATNSASICNVILNAQCDAVVNTAGLAALPPWGHSDLPQIFKSVLDGVRKASEERKQPLRVWFLAGQGILHFPGTETMLSSYIPIYREHRQNFRLLQALPVNTLSWSVLCPNTMAPESTDFTVPAKAPTTKLTASATTPPLWYDSWLRYIPLIGKPIVCAINAPRYATTLEQAADFIASDLEQKESQWVGKPVGVIAAKK
ncbi:NAD(P)-binding protein [Periconia macrospinosa]|uniref:NAD(P)-binding protein n=1 Tax=Periconia macrospinosa TaxID=97972 RepID=A0A2V1DLI8_9PLEO|nr:NAD(P)-binding protein [Periconia macrospinosa]